MRHSRMILLLSLVGALGLTTGCQTASFQYEPGMVDTVRVSRSDSYKNWVEMGGKKEASQKSMQLISEELVLERQVESVVDDVATMKVTIKEASVHFEKELQGKNASRDYVSSDADFKSDWPGAPKLAGASFSVKVASDSTVMAVMGLEDARKSLQIGEGDNDLISRILTEDHIKLFLESPTAKSIKNFNQKVETVEAVTNVMVKAKAVKKTYVPSPAMEENGTKTITVFQSGEPLYVLPAGVAEPKEPADWGRSLIKDKSEMDQFVSGGLATFDMTTGKLLDEKAQLKAILVLPESNVFPDKDSQKKGSSDNVMFTEVEETMAFEVQ